MSRETITEESLERYLSTSNLTDAQKNELRRDFKEKGGSRDVLNKAVTLNNRRLQSKVVGIPHTK